MRFAIVVVEKPTEDVAGIAGKWPSFVAEVSDRSEKAGQTVSTKESLWLLPLPSATGTLAILVSAAQRWGIPHRVLYCAENPDEYTFQPTSP